MVQNPSWESNWFAASQEIPRILWNPKVHYRTHKRPPQMHLSTWTNVHTLALIIHFTTHEVLYKLTVSYL